MNEKIKLGKLLKKRKNLLKRLSKLELLIAQEKETIRNEWKNVLGIDINLKTVNLPGLSDRIKITECLIKNGATESKKGMTAINILIKAGLKRTKMHLFSRYVISPLSPFELGIISNSKGYYIKDTDKAKKWLELAQKLLSESGKK